MARRTSAGRRATRRRRPRRISVVIAAWDERGNLEPLTRRLASVLDSLPESGWEIVYVVEGTDGTKDVLETLAGEIPGLRVLYQPVPQGLGAAFRQGVAAAMPDADVIGTMVGPSRGPSRPGRTARCMSFACIRPSPAASAARPG